MAAIDQRSGSVESHSPPPPTPPPREHRPVAAGAQSMAPQTQLAGQTGPSDQHHQRRQQPRQQVGSRQNAATTQLEFTQAMRDFKTMFPEMDDDVIEVILRANQGAVDATIDQLLAMSTDNENERLRTEMDATENAEAPPGYSPVTPPPTYQQAVPACANQRPAAAATSAAAAVAIVPPKKLPLVNRETSDVPLHQTKNWRPPLLGALPVDFLRIASASDANRRRRTSSRQHEPCSDGGVAAALMASTGVTLLCSAEDIQQKIEENELRRRKLSATSGDGDPDLARCLEDERIALFLQNEEFMSELRSNRDFLSTLELDDSDSDTERPKADASSKAMSDDAGGGNKPTANAEESEDVFREKLSNMGKKSKRKFAQLARLFSRQKKRGGTKPMYPYARLSDGGVGSMPSRDHLLAEDVSDDDDDDDYSDAVADGQTRNEYRPIRNSCNSGPQRCNSSSAT